MHVMHKVIFLLEYCVSHFLTDMIHIRFFESPKNYSNAILTSTFTCWKKNHDFNHLLK